MTEFPITTENVDAIGDLNIKKRGWCVWVSVIDSYKGKDVCFMNKSRSKKEIIIEHTANIDLEIDLLIYKYHF